MSIVYSLYHFPEEKLSEYQESASSNNITSIIQAGLPIAKVTHHPGRVSPARQIKNPFTGELINRPEETILAWDSTEYKQTLYIDKSWPFIKKFILPFVKQPLPLLGIHSFFTPEAGQEGSVALYLTASEVAELNEVLQQINTDDVLSRLSHKTEEMEDIEEWFDYTQSYFNKIKAFYQEATNAGHMITSVLG